MTSFAMLVYMRQFVMWHTFNDENKQKKNSGAKRKRIEKKKKKKKKN